MPPYRSGRQAAAFGSSEVMVSALESPAGVAVPGCHHLTPPCLLVPFRHSEALGVAEGWPCLMPAALYLSASSEKQKRLSHKQHFDTGAE